MTRDEIIDRLRGVVRGASAENLDFQAIKAETTLESLGFDSLSILDLLYDVEQELGIAIDAAEIVEIDTVGGFADLLAGRLEAS